MANNFTVSGLGEQRTFPECLGQGVKAKGGEDHKGKHKGHDKDKKVKKEKKDKGDDE